MTAQAASHPVARRVTNWLQPQTWITAAAIGVGWHADGITGTGWGLVALLFAAGLPTIVIKRGMRAGTVGDRHVGNRHQRIPVLAFAVASVAGGLALLAAAGAPGPVIALDIAMLTTVTILTLITLAWKISLHSAGSSAAVTVLIITFGPAMAALYLLVGLTTWSRIVLRDHTPAQVIAGTLAGAATAALTFLPLR